MPRAEELLRISKALGVSMEWLLTGEDGDAPTREPASSRPKGNAIEAFHKAMEELKDEIDS
jgi:hypothetical protein